MSVAGGTPGSDVWGVGGEGCPLPCDLSHDVCDVTYPPPTMKQMDACENITFLQLRGGGKNQMSIKLIKLWTSCVYRLTCMESVWKEPCMRAPDTSYTKCHNKLL